MTENRVSLTYERLNEIVHGPRKIEHAVGTCGKERSRQPGDTICTVLADSRHLALVGCRTPEFNRRHRAQLGVTDVVREKPSPAVEREARVRVRQAHRVAGTVDTERS